MRTKADFIFLCFMALMLLLSTVFSLRAMDFEAGSGHDFKLYDYKVERVVDGDTVQIEAPYLPQELGKGGLKLRIHGVDTPEKGRFAKCPQEHMLSLKAKYFVEQEVSNAETVKVWFKEWDKYGGRVLGDLLIDSEWLSDKLVKSGYAIPYYGEKKTKDWCK